MNSSEDMIGPDDQLSSEGHESSGEGFSSGLDWGAWEAHEPNASFSARTLALILASVPEEMQGEEKSVSDDDQHQHIDWGAWKACEPAPDFAERVAAQVLGEKRPVRAVTGIAWQDELKLPTKKKSSQRSKWLSICALAACFGGGIAGWYILRSPETTRLQAEISPTADSSAGQPPYLGATQNVPRQESEAASRPNQVTERPTASNDVDVQDLSKKLNSIVRRCGSINGPGRRLEATVKFGPNGLTNDKDIRLSKELKGTRVGTCIKREFRKIEVLSATEAANGADILPITQTVSVIIPFGKPVGASGPKKVGPIFEYENE